MKSLKLNFNLPFSVTKFNIKNKEITNILLTIFLIVLIAAGALPGYLSGGKWSWTNLAQIDNVNVKKLQAIKQKGIEIPGWEIKDQIQIPIGDKKWSVQLMEKDDKEVTLLLLPQTYYLNHPGVEWTDINKLTGWKSDSYQKLKFVTGDNQKVEALFLRSWNPQQTFAVVEWYAWESGGSFAPKNWFWRDLLAQLQKRRKAWIAVCLRIPIEPLGDIESVRETAVSIAQDIQTTLSRTIRTH